MRGFLIPCQIGAQAFVLSVGLAVRSIRVVHLFTHYRLHPLIFGCCPVDHPESGK